MKKTKINEKIFFRRTPQYNCFLTPFLSFCKQISRQELIFLPKKSVFRHIKLDKSHFLVRKTYFWRVKKAVYNLSEVSTFYFSTNSKYC
jgi:hypothetical protein